MIGKILFGAVFLAAIAILVVVRDQEEDYDDLVYGDSPSIPSRSPLYNIAMVKPLRPN